MKSILNLTKYYPSNGLVDVRFPRYRIEFERNWNYGVNISSERVKMCFSYCKNGEDEHRQPQYVLLLGTIKVYKLL